MTETSFRTARLFKILGNPLRYRIMAELFRAPHTPGQLSRLLNRPLHAVSRSLGLLQTANLVSYRTVGLAPVYYPKMDDLYALLLHGERLILNVDLPARIATREGPATAPPLRIRAGIVTSAAPSPPAPDSP